MFIFIYIYIFIFIFIYLYIYIFIYIILSFVCWVFLQDRCITQQTWQRLILSSVKAFVCKSDCGSFLCSSAVVCKAWLHVWACLSVFILLLARHWYFMIYDLHTYTSHYAPQSSRDPIRFAGSESNDACELFALCHGPLLHLCGLERGLCLVREQPQRLDALDSTEERLFRRTRDV